MHPGLNNKINWTIARAPAPNASGATAKLEFCQLIFSLEVDDGPDSKTDRLGCDLGLQ